MTPANSVPGTRLSIGRNMQTCHRLSPLGAYSPVTLKLAKKASAL